MINLVYLYLFAPLHTGGTTQEGNLLGIARESHTNLSYIHDSLDFRSLKDFGSLYPRSRDYLNHIARMTIIF